LLRMSSLFRFLRDVGMVFDGGECREDVCIATIADKSLPNQAGRWLGINARDVYARTIIQMHLDDMLKILMQRNKG
jgi:hypothetical protein